MAGTTWPSLVASTTAFAADVEAKFDWIEGHLVPMLAGSLTDAAYDLGTTTARWNNIHAKTARIYNDLVFGYGTTTARALVDTGTTSLLVHMQGGANIPFMKVYASQFNVYASGSVLALSVNTAGAVALRNGVAINEFSSDTGLTDQSDLAVPTEKAVRTYVDNLARPYDTGSTSAPTTSPSGLITATTLNMSLTSGDRVYVDGYAWAGWSGATSTTQIYLYLNYNAVTYMIAKMGNFVSNITASTSVSANIYGGHILSIASTGSNKFTLLVDRTNTSSFGVRGYSLKANRL